MPARYFLFASPYDYYLVVSITRCCIITVTINFRVLGPYAQNYSRHETPNTADKRCLSRPFIDNALYNATHDYFLYHYLQRHYIVAENQFRADTQSACPVPDPPPH